MNLWLTPIPKPQLRSAMFALLEVMYVHKQIISNMYLVWGLLQLHYVLASNKSIRHY